MFNYGNQLALALFEMDWEKFTSLSSRLSAELVNREERTRLLADVTRHGFIDDYSGIRISARKRRFAIQDATVWNLLDAAGYHYGQAAVIRSWEYLKQENFIPPDASGNEVLQEATVGQKEGGASASPFTMANSDIRDY